VAARDRCGYPDHAAGYWLRCRKSNAHYRDGLVGTEHRFQLSPWALKAAETGTYRITLYLHDEPAGKEIPHSFAHLELNGEVSTQPIGEGSISSTFEVSLDAGNLDVRAWFDDSEDASGQPLAAFYLIFERI
jgi:hypothetical protein